MPMNMSWFPRFIVAWSIPMSSAKPSVRALARFMRSSWKTRRPRKSSGRTEESILSGGCNKLLVSTSKDASELDRKG